MNDSQSTTIKQAQAAVSKAMTAAKAGPDLSGEPSQRSPLLAAQQVHASLAAIKGLKGLKGAGGAGS